MAQVMALTLTSATVSCKNRAYPQANHVETPVHQWRRAAFPKTTYRKVGHMPPYLSRGLVVALSITDLHSCLILWIARAFILSFLIRGVQERLVNGLNRFEITFRLIQHLFG